ncbi:MAG: VOC family protein [Deltaproteobacteria bacterium]|nr:VOC family protein [Deltaproteobacteria bacterium]
MIKVSDIAYVRFGAPDLDGMEKFLGDFGLAVTTRDDSRLFARGSDPSPYVHVTELGDPGFRGVAFEAATAEDLAAAAKLEGASAIEKLDAPGGGQCVRFTDPDGFGIEVVHGRELLEPLPVRAASPLNRGSEQARLGTLQRVPAGPAQVKRLGHMVLRVTDYAISNEWYCSRFGFLPSDHACLGDPEKVLATFLRCDRGEEYVDHHTFLCVGAGQAAFDHAAFEVEDFDAVMAGHDQLAAAGYGHHAGIGRHFLGSQVFDYWQDPWGNVVEHFTDGDLLNASTPAAYHEPSVVLGTQWGKFMRVA